MKCAKCNLYTRTFRIPSISDNEGLPVCLCGSCAAEFIAKLSEWKDFDYREELDFWISGNLKEPNI